MANSKSTGSLGVLWMSWRLASPFYRSLSMAATQVAISESYLARIEKGVHRPSARLVYRLVRLYLPSQVPDDVALTISSAIDGHLKAVEVPIITINAQIWHTIVQQIGVVASSRIAYVLSVSLFGSGRMPPEIAPGVLPESGYGWLLFRWVALADTQDGGCVNELLQLSRRHQWSSTEWFNRLSDLPVPEPEDPPADTPALLSLWSQIPEPRRVEALRALRRFAAGEGDNLPLTASQLDRIESKVDQLLRSRESREE